MGTHDTADNGLRFGLTNLAFGVGSAASIVLGYWFLNQGSITIAPVLLVLGYVVLAPLAVLK